MEPSRVALPLLLCAGLALPVGATATQREGTESTSDIRDTVTVAGFLIDIARSVDPALADPVTVQQAVASLTEAGLEVPDDIDPDSTLTEGDVVRFASTAGLRLRSLEPGEPFPSSKMDALRILLVGGLTGSDEMVRNRLRGDSGSDNAGGSERAREKRKKKKVFESPSIPPGQEGKN